MMEIDPRTYCDKVDDDLRNERDNGADEMQGMCPDALMNSVWVSQRRILKRKVSLESRNMMSNHVEK